MIDNITDNSISFILQRTALFHDSHFPSHLAYIAYKNMEMVLLQSTSK
jgi:hypothetical protein